MKLKIANNNGIVTSAHFEEAELSFSLYINTKERHLRPDIETSEKGERSWIYSVQDGEEFIYDEVTLIAESTAEEKALDRYAFELLDKNQLWLMLPADSVIELEKS